MYPFIKFYSPFTAYIDCFTNALNALMLLVRFPLLGCNSEGHSLRALLRDERVVLGFRVLVNLIQSIRRVFLTRWNSWVSG